MFIDSLFSLAFASRFVVLSLLFELTSFLLRFLSFSSSAILFSMFNPRGRYSVIWDCIISNQVLLRLLFIFAFNFGFVFVLSLVNTLLAFSSLRSFINSSELTPLLGSTLCALGGFLTDILHHIASILFVNKAWNNIFTILYIVLWRVFQCSYIKC